MNLEIPAFAEAYSDHCENKNARVITIKQATEENFHHYCNLLEANGFVKKLLRCLDIRCFAAYVRGTDGVFLNYYKNTSELTVVMEDQCTYFSYTDLCEGGCVPAQITQVHLEDFGMSYVIRLSDGRFIVIDGGRELEPDAERLMECLREGAGGRKPIIAAWIMTHPHSDHYYCFFPFIDRYREEVVIQKFLLNFPAADDLIHYPGLVAKKLQDEGCTESREMLRLFEIIKELGAPVYVPHTGQIYRIGDAVLEILACMDDTIHCSDNVNAISLVIRMELGGQVILWATDASFGAARLSERYGDYLKSDILQVPHHGFSMGPTEDTIAGYQLILPKVCLLPVSDYNAFTAFCAFRECTDYLMTQCGVEELITGEKTRTLTLPYKPDVNGVRLLRKEYLSGKENAGACTWVFTELNTARPEDFQFTILNTTHGEAEVFIELYFEEGLGKIRFIKATVMPVRLRKINIIDSGDVERDTAYYNPWSLEKHEIPISVPFAVRFLSKVPVIVSHKEHIASYRTSVFH